MSQDLFFIPLEEENEGFDRKMVTDILSKGATEPVACLECLYPDGSRGEVDGIDDDPAQVQIEHFGFVHFGGRMMMERIYALADALDVFLVWSDAGEDEPNACVTRPERIERISAEAKGALVLAVARDPSHLNELVKGQSFEAAGW